MGRAAAVRAATKGKTDAKKAKINGYYGKKIIMAVKQGGSSDPVANRQLADLIKAAKNNSVPIDVSSGVYAICAVLLFASVLFFCICPTLHSRIPAPPTHTRSLHRMIT
jgi:hypothetical protein